jgi:ABC-2 type transport system permease protein
MTAVTSHQGRAAGTQRQLPGLITHEFGSDLRCFRRNVQSVFFTLALPVLFLVILASIFRNATVKVPGGIMKESVYYVPGIIAFGLIAATFSNLVTNVVHYREAGIYKRRGATPVSSSVIVVGRALVSALSAVVITVVLLAIGWLAFAAHIPGRTGLAFLLDVVVGAVVFCILAFAVSTVIKDADAAQPAVLGLILPLSMISGVFIPILELPNWLIDVAKVFPVHALADALLAAYNPHTLGSGVNWTDLGILAAWGIAGLFIAIRRFSWMPRGS